MLEKLKKSLRYLVLTSAIGLTSCASVESLVNKQYYNSESDYKKVIKEVDSIDEAVAYCLNYLEYWSDKEQYGKECWVSFKRINKSGKDDCDGGAVAAGALLSDNGYSFTVLCMDNEQVGHAVFLYKENGKYGSIGINKCDCNSATFGTIDDLVKHISKEILDSSEKGVLEKAKHLDKGFNRYWVLDFSDYKNEFIESDNFLDSIVDEVYHKSECHYIK